MKFEIINIIFIFLLAVGFIMIPIVFFIPKAVLLGNFLSLINGIFIAAVILGFIFYRARPT